ncbi:ParB/RepB/Spo0J family partition protein [Kutzneria buriramensis]|uniref:ParB-like nuclease family protein n=1 Tax=Kutzneria buriramensis TaxID=1045776 RepID=A0A3E0G613_9PSEU|nr:ParB/RepB/Spo0J family partition protein [Kutzneria buriramensis]REH18163.1 ParB-like nuclease family protein [Kutzneria buriramensis]
MNRFDSTVSAADAAEPDDHRLRAAAYLDRTDVVLVPVGALLPPDSPRLDGESEEHARVLAESQADLPPIFVQRGTMRVIDGAHRLRAAMLRGEREIGVCFYDGDDEDAFVLAVESNIAHGLPLSLADRTAAAARIIAARPQWSDRAIARSTGLAPNTVAGIRRRATAQSAQLHARVGRDGRSRPVNGASGRKLAGELIAVNPEASLREIAKVAGISVGTARDVRDRVRRGEDVLPPRQRSLENRGAVEVNGRKPTGERTSTLQNLRRDPSLRFTEAGRFLLRLLEVNKAGVESRERLVDTVPPHCASAVLELARDYAADWQEFASLLERRLRASA